MSTTYRMSASTTRGVRYYLYQYWQDTGDQRTAGLPLIREGPWAMITVMAIYLLFVQKFGPKMMKNREAYQLRVPMFIYNAVMVAVNFHFFFESIKWLDYGRQLLNFKWPDGQDSTPKTMAFIWSFYLYWLSKFVDLLDTVFFVLRKKQRQISTLHLYHHTAVPVLGWLFIWHRLGAPAVSLFALLNSFVHVIMYSYYALAAFGQRIQKYLWWKRYITQIQLLQFAILCGYGVVVFSFQQNYPPVAFWLAASQPALFLVMFSNFYFITYSKSKSL